MKNTKEILAENRNDIIDLLKSYFPSFDTVNQMKLFYNYCVENELNEDSNVYDYLVNFYYAQIANGVQEMPKPKSNDINDLTKSIRMNTRNRWGI